MNFAEIKGILDESKWTFAKTMPTIPHYWTARNQWNNDFLFDSVVLFIRANGKAESFGKKQFVYLYLGDYKYWTMGAEISETRIINRAKI